MDNRQYLTKDSVLERGREIIGIPLRDIDSIGRLGSSKGDIGNLVEESWFGIKVNNDSEPDFKEAGVELKVTPYIYNRNGLRAKERLVCNIINYMEEHKNTFCTSRFWKKCNTILLMMYEHIYNMDKGDYFIDETVLFNFSSEDLAIIEQDWNYIISKVRNGKAHELSEGDTLYLGACTKGGKTTKPRQQPFSDIGAKQRAYSLKQSYMTYVLNNYIYGEETPNNIIKDSNTLKSISFEDYINEKVSPYIGYSQQKLLQAFNIDTKAKHINEIILSHILGVQGRVSATDEFKKANIIPKTIRVQKNGKIKESMSFPEFSFSEIISEEWDDSQWKCYIESAKFLFVIFKENEEKNLIFDSIKFWNIPKVDLDEVGRVWQNTVDVIRRGVKLTLIGNRVTNDFPKSTDSEIAHVRPKSKYSAYRFDDVVIGSLKNADELPDGRWMTKQCFWFNNSYIQSIICGFDPKL